MNALLLLGCAEAPPPAASVGPVWTETRQVGSGEAVVVHAPADTPPPAAEGLTVSPSAAARPGEVAWEVRGADGSYLLEVRPPGAEPVTLYVDIGVQGPSGGPMAELVAAEPPPPPIWPQVLAGVLGLVLLLVLARMIQVRLRRRPVVTVSDPPDVVARREWRALRARSDLPPDALAVALSEVYRRYLEAARGWPATRRTTREVLDNLAGELTAAELEAAGRLLRAMDLVKFSGRDPTADLFPALDQDFERLVRPGSGP